MSKSPLSQARLNYVPDVPSQLIDLSELEIKKVACQRNVRGQESVDELQQIFPLSFDLPELYFSRCSNKPHYPLRVGVVFSGGQAAGGHNVIAGLFDALKKLHFQSSIIGFIGGVSGIIEKKFIEIQSSFLDNYRNQGGFDLIGSGRTKIETPEQFRAALQTVKDLNLHGLVIIGGDDSNTNAALLTEYFLKNDCSCRIVGVPKTVDGDLKNEWIEVSFGFDTACKTYSNIIGNILRDALSAKKYYHFIKIMGRSASHVALECAHQTHPNLTLIGEEVEAEKFTISRIINQICDAICKRAEVNKNYGVIIIPEGLIEFIPECKQLLKELNLILVNPSHSTLLNSLPNEQKIDYVLKQLTPASIKCLSLFPYEMKWQLLLDRDPHGNIQVSKIEIERFIIELVTQQLSKRREEGTYKGKWSPQPHFLGYEGRSAFPSNFDCQYCYSLGQGAALLIDSEATGYMCCIQNLTKPVVDWRLAAIPFTWMMQMEERKGQKKPVIQKRLVDLAGPVFSSFKIQRESWKFDDDYLYPGPLQFFGPPEITDSIVLTLQQERQ